MAKEVLVLALIGALLCLACGLIPAAEPTPSPIPTGSDAATATPTSTPTPAHSITVGTQPEPGWQTHETEEFAISLPSTWESFPLEREAIEFMIGMWEPSNPRVAEYIDFFVQAGLHEEIDFWAMDTEATEFVSNVNVLSIPMPVSASLYVPSTVGEIERMGATIISTDDALEIDGLLTARIEYSVPMELPRSGVVVARGVQYAIFAGSTTYVLTFTTAEELTNNMAPIFEMSANSFDLFGQ